MSSMPKAAYCLEALMKPGQIPIQSLHVRFRVRASWSRKTLSPAGVDVGDKNVEPQAVERADQANLLAPLSGVGQSSASISDKIPMKVPLIKMSNTTQFLTDSVINSIKHSILSWH